MTHRGTRPHQFAADGVCVVCAMRSTWAGAREYCSGVLRTVAMGRARRTFRAQLVLRGLAVALATRVPKARIPQVRSVRVKRAASVEQLCLLAVAA